MPHHSTKNTISREAWCKVCNKATQHYVWDGRLGSCQNDHPHPEKKKKPEQTSQLNFFDQTKETE